MKTVSEKPGFYWYKYSGGIWEIVLLNSVGNVFRIGSAIPKRLSQCKKEGEWGERITHFAAGMKEPKP